MCRFLSRVVLLGLLMGSNRALAYCWADVASRYDIEPELLQAIAAVEFGVSRGCDEPRQP